MCVCVCVGVQISPPSRNARHLTSPLAQGQVSHQVPNAPYSHILLHPHLFFSLSLSLPLPPPLSPSPSLPPSLSPSLPLPLSTLTGVLPCPISSSTASPPHAPRSPLSATRATRASSACSHSHCYAFEHHTCSLRCGPQPHPTSRPNHPHHPLPYPPPLSHLANPLFPPPFPSPSPRDPRSFATFRALPLGPTSSRLSSAAPSPLQRPPRNTSRCSTRSRAARRPNGERPWESALCEWSDIDIR